MDSKSLNNKVILLLSGGIDSSTCLHYYKSKQYSVSALFVDYNQPYSSKEFSAAQSIAKLYDVPLVDIKVSNDPIAVGYVPARNAMLLTIALMKMGGESGIIAIGIHAGTSYADCSPHFIQKMQDVYDLYTGGCVHIDAPFLRWSKSDIWDYAQKHNVPLHLTCSNNLPDLYPVANNL